MKHSLLFAFLLLVSCAHAQQALEFAPAFRNYSTDRGLPNNCVYDIYQDKTGYIWVATDNGVCRFDGYAFEQFSDTLNANLTSVMTGAMAEDERGRLWYVDFQSRLFYIENGIIHPYPHNAVIAAQKGQTDFFHGLMVEGGGADIWLVSRDNGGVLHLWGDGQYEHILPSAYHNLQIFEKNGKSQYSINEWDIEIQQTTIVLSTPDSIRVWVLPSPSEKRMDSGYLAQRLSGDRWCLYLRGYLYLLQQGTLAWMRPSEKIPHSLWEEPDGALLVGYRQGGLARYRSMDDFRAARPEGQFLPGLSISKITRDREGGYWIGTQQQGLFYCPAWNRGSMAQIPLLASQEVVALASDGLHRLFAGTEEGHILEVDAVTEQWIELPPSGCQFLNRLHFNPHSQTLAAAGEPSAFYYKDRWEIFNSYREVAGLAAKMTSKCLYPSGGSRSWITVGVNRLVKFSLDKPFVVSDESNNATTTPTRFYTVLEAPDGRVWASRNDGLVEWKIGAGLLRPPIEHPAFRQTFLDIDLLADSSLVFCPKGHGVVIWKPGSTEVTEIGTKEGLLSNRIHGLHVGANGVIWACTHNGLGRLTPLGPRQYRVDNFTVQHGLPSNTVNDVTTLGDEVWVATAKGLFRMQEKPSETPIPASLFTRVLVNNVLYPSATFSSLPHDSANVVIEYLSLYFRSNGHIPYRFRLLRPGGDTLWTVTRQRQVYFSNLSPNAYRFEVQAQDEDGRWSPVSVLAFTIRPPWWATWWARTAGATVLGVLVFAAYRYRIGQIQKEGALREEMYRLEQSALQAQMNPHFIFNCLNSIQHFILKNEPDAAVLYLAKFAKLVRGTLNASVSGIVSLEEEIKMLEHYLNLEQLRFKQAFEYHIEVDEHLDREHTLLPPLIVQPFVENSVLHGMKDLKRNGVIVVKFYPDHGLLCVEVQDNGLGLDPSKLKQAGGSLGSSITRRRLELLNEQRKKDDISVAYSTPSEGSGTMVRLRLPLRQTIVPNHEKTNFPNTDH